MLRIYKKNITRFSLWFLSIIFTFHAHTSFASFLSELTAYQNSEEQTDYEEHDDLFENFKKLNGDPRSLKQALCFYNKYKDTHFVAKGDPSRGYIQIGNEKYIAINDLTQDKFQARFYVINLETGNIYSTISAHGGGRDTRTFFDNVYVANHTSNHPNSFLSPRGFFITGERKVSSMPKWKYSMKLYGLQKDINDQSFDRAIIVHPYPGIEAKLFSSNDPIPPKKVRPYGSKDVHLSQGCTMLSPTYASKIIDLIKAPSNSNRGGALYYNYTLEEKSYGDNYCGNHLMTH
jgi:hypothetical protein